MAQTQNELSSNIAIYPILDVTQIQSMDVKSPEFKELIIRLTQQINNQTLAVNNRDTGLYDTEEYVSGRTFFPNPAIAGSTGKQVPANRPVYRKTFYWGKPLPATGQDSIVHGITNIAGFSITRIYGATTDPTNKLYFPLPYVADSKDEPISLWATSTDIFVDVYGTDRSAFTITYIIIEYLKN